MIEQLFRKAVFLIGPRAAGKTTLARMLAVEMGMEPLDTDKHIASMGYGSIETIVHRHGWPFFRELEGKVLAEMSQKKAVIATGGGVVLDEANRKLIRERGWVIYLEVTPEELIRRLQYQPQPENRPSLTGKALLEEVAEVLSTREELYRKSAHFTVRNMTSPEEAMQMCLLWLKRQNHGSITNA